MINSIIIYNTLLAMNFTNLEAKELTCIAFKESTLRENVAHYNVNGTWDYGMFQINQIWIPECQTTRRKLLTYNGNITCAAHLYRKHGPEIWTTSEKCI